MEIKSLLSDVETEKRIQKKPDVVVHGKYLKKDIDSDMEPIYDEDLAAIHPISEREILELLEKRLELGDIYTYIGDLLLSLNPNERKSIFGNDVSFTNFVIFCLIL